MDLRFLVLPGRLEDGRDEMDRAKAEATEKRLRKLVRTVCDSASGQLRDTGAAIDCLCRLAVAELDLLGAAVTLMTAAAPGSDRVKGSVDAPGAAPVSQVVAGASDEQSNELEHLQFNLGEGPGVQAFTTGRPVLVPDLEAAFERWPAYSTSALRAGLGSVNAFPLQLGAVRFGTLTLYDADRRPLSPDEVTTCLTLAELGTERLLESSDGSTSHTLDLSRTFRFRSEVYQAQGKLAVQLGVSLAHALLLMRARAFSTDRDLTDLAIDILDGTAEMGHHSN